jgi:hypothetical protein
MQAFEFYLEFYHPDKVDLWFSYKSRIEGFEDELRNKISYIEPYTVPTHDMDYNVAKKTLEALFGAVEPKHKRIFRVWTECSTEFSSALAKRFALTPSGLKKEFSVIQPKMAGRPEFTKAGLKENLFNYDTLLRAAFAASAQALTVTRTFRVYRGIKFLETWQGSIVDTPCPFVIKNVSYASTTIHPDTATFFLQNLSILMELTVPVGFRQGAFVREVSKFRREDEFLLSRDSEIVVQNVTTRVIDDMLVWVFQGYVQNGTVSNLYGGGYDDNNVGIELPYDGVDRSDGQQIAAYRPDVTPFVVLDDMLPPGPTDAYTEKDLEGVRTVLESMIDHGDRQLIDPLDHMSDDSQRVDTGETEEVDDVQFTQKEISRLPYQPAQEEAYVGDGGYRRDPVSPAQVAAMVALCATTALMAVLGK